MLEVAEDRRPALRLVAADPLEDAAAVVEAVAEDVVFASSQATNSPFIQMNSAFSIGREVCPISRGVRERLQASTRFGTPSSPRCHLARAVAGEVGGAQAAARARSRRPPRPGRRRPRGRARGGASSPPRGRSRAGWRCPVPAMSGAEPWTGSNRPGPSAPRLAEGSIPSEPVSIAASSLRMSPNRFSVRITSKSRGPETSCIAALSTSMWSSSTSG